MTLNNDGVCSKHGCLNDKEKEKQNYRNSHFLRVGGVLCETQLVKTFHFFYQQEINVKFVPCLTHFFICKNYIRNNHILVKWRKELTKFERF